MGSKTFDGVRFSAWTDDHLPPHVHAFYAGVAAILELDFNEREIRLARRRDRIRPRDAKRADVNYIRQAAQKYREELFQLWEAARG